MSTGALHVIDTDKGQKCTSAETAITWNQTGPSDHRSLWDRLKKGQLADLPEMLPASW